MHTYDSHTVARAPLVHVKLNMRSYRSYDPKVRQPRQPRQLQAKGDHLQVFEVLLAQVLHCRRSPVLRCRGEQDELEAPVQGFKEFPCARA